MYRHTRHTLPIITTITCIVLTYVRAFLSDLNHMICHKDCVKEGVQCLTSMHIICWSSYGRTDQLHCEIYMSVLTCSQWLLLSSCSSDHISHLIRHCLIFLYWSIIRFKTAPKGLWLQGAVVFTFSLIMSFRFIIFKWLPYSNMHCNNFESRI